MPFDSTLLEAHIKKTIVVVLVFMLPVSISSVRSDSSGGSNHAPEPPYDSTVSTAFDIIHSSDVSAFSCLKYMGRLERQVWDKRVDGEPYINTFLFHAHYADGSYIKIVVNPEFENVDGLLFTLTEQPSESKTIIWKSRCFTRLFMRPGMTSYACR